jgi:hypothetical protein
MIMLPKEKREELVAKIEPLRQQVEAWRKARRPNEHMPESFWEPATQLAKEYGLAPVQGILGIDYRGLQRRVSGVRPPPPAKKALASFVELPALSPPRRTEHTLELEDASGRRLSIKLSGGSLSELAPVIQAFWKPGL